MMISEVLSKAVASQSFYIEARDLLTKLDGTNIEKSVLRLINRFFEKYERTPSREELLLFFYDIPEQEAKFIQEYKDFVNRIYKESSNGIDPAVLLREMKDKISKSDIKETIIKVVDNFERTETKQIIETLQNAVMGATEEDRHRRVEVDATDVEGNIGFVKYQKSERIPTAIPSLDSILYGGVGQREMATVVAPSGRGKTAFLINLMFGFMLQGYTVLYITLEMSVVDIMRRLYRRILYKGKDYLGGQNDEEMKKWLRKFFGGSRSKGKVVYCPANVYSTEDLETDIMKMELGGAFYPDVIILDHLDLITTRSKNIRQREMYAYWRLIVDNLRIIPLTRGIPIVTATQGTRKSTEKVLLTDVDVGESYGKVQSSDVVLSLNQSPEAYQNKRMLVGTLKNRDYQKGNTAELYCNLDMMTMCDLMFAQMNGWLV
jgi:archaellum biogenesis ATPase FlaH